MNALEYTAGLGLAAHRPADTSAADGRSELRAPRHRRDLVLAAIGESAAEARRFARETLQLWALDAELVQGVQLVVSELVTNAICHHSGQSAGFTVRLRIEHARGVLAIGVSDPHPGMPVRRSPDGEATHGRGLLLAGAYCDEWTVVPTGAGGKQVCAFWNLQPPAAVRDDRRHSGRLPVSG
ncbi:ATP-binding protein [Kitasatospora sp. NPDC048540]|uniref:ATP-binding protein n=1 Tax=Kitasatospora sp. NPDC048540 TaxID=3155634 RepID=UPI0033C7D9F6